MTPRATVRLQLHAGFTFEHARQALNHYADLGVSHLYLSPITRARTGSTHGYDVIDPTRVSDALGGLDGFRRLAGDAAARGLGLIVDIVPNHMAAHPQNPWWHDVLAHGSKSPYAAYFDIDWAAGGGRLLLPILPKPYGVALADGDIRLASEDGKPIVCAGGQKLPLTAGVAVTPMPAGVDPEAVDTMRLHALLEQQHYRLAWWRTASDSLNWRRFFEISELVGLRIERRRVFDATHGLVLDLYGEGLLDGVRVDHIDGLAEPAAYLRRLRSALWKAAPARRPYLVVEKILAPHEELDPRWPVDGTTGYEFMDDVSALFHAPAARSVLESFWRKCGGPAASHEQQLRAVRSHILERHLGSERHAAVASWARVLGSDLRTRDWSADALQRMLTTWLAGFPSYRSYAEDGGPSMADRAAWEEATRQARPRLSTPDRMLLDAWMDRLRRAAVETPEALRRLQQLTPALAAKSLEDTLHYRFGMLLSRNEVGAWPQQFAISAERFHARNAARARYHPRTLLATATHDHKRGEDVRARLAVLTEMPHAWSELALQWLDTLPPGMPATTDRYMLLQMLVGSWPSAWGADVRRIEPARVRRWLARIAQWQQKGLREAKLRTSWTDPDPAYEQAAQHCLDTLDPDAADRRPLDTLASLAVPLVIPGQINSLAQTLLRNTCPGVPDLYQGAETWDESLVDPDNRRPVDDAALQRLLHKPALTTPKAADWRSGRIKQRLIQQALSLRASQPSLFDETSSYIPVFAHGLRAAHVVAYLRAHGNRYALVVVPRLCSLRLAAQMVAGDSDRNAFWQGTRLRLPPTCAGQWEDVLGGQRFQVEKDGELSLSRLVRRWPVALCSRCG